MAAEKLVGGFVGRSSYSKSTTLSPIRLKFRRILLNLMIKTVGEELRSLLPWFGTYKVDGRVFGW